MNQPSREVSSPRGQPAPRPDSATRRGMGAVGLAILGGIVAFVGLAPVGGSGWSPLLHILLGLVGAPALDAFIRRLSPERGYVAQLAILLAVGVASAGLGAATARPNPSAAFQRAFGIPPPRGVSNLSARRRWFDGPVFAIRFKADADAIATTVAGRPFTPGEPDLTTTDPADWPTRWRSALSWGIIADPSWKDAPTMTAPRSFQWRSPGKSTVLVWDAATGEGYAQYGEGGTD